MEQAVDEPASALQQKIPVKLPGLPYILHERKIPHPEVAKRLGVASRRVYNVSRSNVRAEPWEIARLMEYLQVSYEQLTTVPENPPPLPVRRRLPREKVPDTESSPNDAPMPPDNRSLIAPEIAPPSNQLDVSRGVLPAGIALKISLPNGQSFDISSGQPASSDTLARMARALFLLAISGR